MSTNQTLSNYETEAQENFKLKDFSELLSHWDGELSTLANDAFILGYARALQNHKK
ncbi:hypothetical protein [Hominilimicola sp.]|jgi:hypothetical protein|uniref:hypothetical protein n=1 Tax=Hominilimicola sp. TaxID=3073571 RepID=UPI00206B7F2A|nr:MAG TPA: hypothetical protein [Caudoviricetes sp.]